MNKSRGIEVSGDIFGLVSASHPHPSVFTYLIGSTNVLYAKTSRLNSNGEDDEWKQKCIHVACVKLTVFDDSGV